jgi:hypothetical protein
MAGDGYEPNRFLGFPVRPKPHAGQGENQREEPRPHAERSEEPQRVMGFPVDSFGPVDLDWLRSLTHPVRGYQRWVRRRRLGPYATDEDEPGRRDSAT